MLLDDVHRRRPSSWPYNIVAMMLIVTAFIVGFSTALTRFTANAAIGSILVLEIVAGLGPHDRPSKAIIPLAIFCLRLFS